MVFNSILSFIADTIVTGMNLWLLSISELPPDFFDNQGIKWDILDSNQ